MRLVCFRESASKTVSTIAFITVCILMGPGTGVMNGSAGQEFNAVLQWRLRDMQPCHELGKL
ncbi:hypothetical protein BDW74DRAFT_150921 [Aspergillus multicolor]|uniref:uncharacterized protein n=1 Tax=Aspergillus multicolor TaxID=41759 RepID=UPI003CCC9848